MPTASIAGKKITLAWVAANEASQKAIEALIPANLTDLSQLPRSIPSSVQLKPQIIVEGEVKAEGSSFSAGSEPLGAGSFTKYGSNQWDTTTDQLIAGQQTALGVSIQGISQKQLQTLKTRMEATNTKIEQVKDAPENQYETILKDMTGELISGDLLTATIWGYLVTLETYGIVKGSEAGVLDLPGLQYGLFHAQVKTRKLWGMVTNGISFEGLNMDVGHIRGIRWVKDDNPKSVINNQIQQVQNGKSAAQNRWITYNKDKGSYSSAQEHATPEALWVDKSQCKYTGSQGQIQNPTLGACVEAISAVKALGIAQAEGQRIYTINKENRDTALPKLSISGNAASEIINAINAGKEVTFHEKAINAHGWTGYGYIIIDPDTGAGAYLIEGKGNGAIFYIVGVMIGTIISMLLIAPKTASGLGKIAAILWPYLAAVAVGMGIIYAFASQNQKDFLLSCLYSGIMAPLIVGRESRLLIIRQLLLYWL